jgi:MFS family permease
MSALLAYGISIIGCLCALAITGPGDHVLLWLHAVLFGLTWGARGPAITAKTADLFPGPRLGTILGVITVGSGLGAALGSWGAGLVFDLSRQLPPGLPALHRRLCGGRGLLLVAPAVARQGQCLEVIESIARNAFR